MNAGLTQHHSQPYNVRARIQRLVRLGREKERDKKCFQMLLNMLEPPDTLRLRLNKLIPVQVYKNLYSQFRSQGRFSSFSGTPIILIRTLGTKL